MSEQALKKVITNHPFIVKKEDTCSESPIIGRFKQILFYDTDAF